MVLLVTRNVLLKREKREAKKAAAAAEAARKAKERAEIKAEMKRRLKTVGYILTALIGIASVIVFLLFFML